MDDDLDFEVDLVAEGDESNFHLPNMPGEESRRIFAQTTNEKSPLNTRIRLVEVHHGQMVHEYDECQATLLVIEFRFQSRLAGRRYQSISVTLEFLDKSGNPRRDPAVVNLAPDRMHWLNKTTYDRRTRYGASAGLTGGGGVVDGEAKVEWEMEQTRPLKFKATLTGQPGRSKGKGGDDENTVTWTMQENPDEADGVPSFLQTAVLLKRRYGTPFIAKLRIHSEVDIVSAARRALSTRTDEDKIIDPVAFTPGMVQVRNNSVSGITDGDLEHMERLDIGKLFRVNLSEQDKLTPDRADATKEGVAEQEGATEATEAEATDATERTAEGAAGEGTEDGGTNAECATGVELPILPELRSPLSSPSAKRPIPSAGKPTSAPPPHDDTQPPSPATLVLSSVAAAAAAAAAAAEAAAKAAEAAAMAAAAAANAAQAAAKAAEAAVFAIGKQSRSVS